MNPPASHSVDSHIRLHYLFFFLGIGCAFPYLGPFLKEHYHLSNRELGLVGMVAPVVAILTKGFWTYLADRTGRRTTVAAFLCAAAGFAILLIPAFHDIRLLIPSLALYHFFFVPISPLVDSAVFIHLGPGRKGIYGNLRLWGTLGFAISSWLIGPLLDRHGMAWGFPFCTLFLLISAGFIRGVPPAAAHREQVAFFQSLRLLLANRNVLLFLVSAFLASMANTMSYQFLSIHMGELGANRTAIGFLWFMGGPGEIVFMIWSGYIIGRVGLKRLLVFSALCVSLRWTLTAVVPDWCWLAPVNLLHAFNFAALLVGAIRFMDTSSPPGIRSSAQALFYIVNLHICTIVTSPIAGEIAERFGLQALYATAGGLGLAAAGLLALLIREPARPPEREPEAIPLEW